MQQSVKIKKPSVHNGPNMASAEKTGNLWNRNAGEAARDAVSLAMEIKKKTVNNLSYYMPVSQELRNTKFTI